MPLNRSVGVGFVLDGVFSIKCIHYIVSNYSCDRPWCNIGPFIREFVLKKVSIFND